MSHKIKDMYIGLKPDGNYELTKKIGTGKIGSVYKAIRHDPSDILACKIISAEKLKNGWDRELEKVVKLRGVPNVVEYHAHGSGLDHNKKAYIWILWNYIKGENLREYISSPPSSMIP